MKLFISGGTGVLGKRVIPILLESGHELGVLSRSQKNDELIKQMGAIPIKTNLFDPDSLKNSLGQYEGILHLATAIPRSNRTSTKDWDLNKKIRLEGTSNLVKAALTHKMKLFILQSVTFVYGHQNGEWVDEETNPNIPVKNAEKLSKDFQAHSDSNVQMEQEFLNKVKKDSLPGIILRFGWFYSYDSTNIPGMVKRKFPLTGDGEAYWNLIQVDDAAQAVTKTVANFEQNIGKIYNIVDNEPVKVKDLLQYVAEKTGHDKPPRMPERLVKLYSGSQGLNFIKSSVRVKNEKAKNELKWNPQFPTYKEGFEHEIKKYFLLNQ